ncbi:MAG: TldD/PmbA family protein [DPANN group archaeon]|nr:TldD/PmbA family protein [DPANN group archaeon]
MYEDLAEFAVKFATKSGASYAEARAEQTQSNVFVLKNGTLDISGFEDSFGIGIRMINKGTLGFVSTNLTSKDAIKKIIEESLSITSAAQKISENTKLSEEKPVKKSYSVPEKKKINNVSPKTKIELLKSIDAKLNATKIKMPTCYFSLSDETIEKYYTNSDGTRIKSVIPRPNIFYMFAVKEGAKTSQRMWQYGGTGGWEIVEKWKLPSTIQNEAKDLHNALVNGENCPKGELDVVASPQITGIISHESCGHPFEADRILGREAAQAGESFITKQMLGTRIGNKAVTLIEDPTLKNSYGFYLYDDEGVKARKRILVNKGVINDFLHNRETAYEFGVKSNGAARASEFDKEAIVRMANTFIDKGDYNFKELIEGVKKGIYLKSFMEWNIDDKRYNNRYVGNEAYLIENGKIKHPVKNPAIEITTPALYMSIDACGKDMEWHSATCGKGEPMQGIPVTHGGPTIRIKNVRLSS